MPTQTREVKPGPRPRTVLTQSGDLLHVPEGWSLLKPGDAAVTRKVKAAGPSWTVKEKRGRRIFSKGVWAPTEHIQTAIKAVESQRQDPEYQRKLHNSRVRRQEKEVDYQLEFKRTIYKQLNFHPKYAAFAKQMSILISDHATPVGSGTVARTKRIPIEERANAAIYAWMRHKTSSYDNISVPKVKGARRELRRKIAATSTKILQRYRAGEAINTSTCMLYRALAGVQSAPYTRK